MVAGEVYLSIQAGERTLGPAAICQRPQHVLYALETELEKPCADITINDLALVRKLRVRSGWGTGRLSWAGAFLGLVNLASLEFGTRDVLTLQLGTFDGLPNLYKLNLENNRNLRTIQSGAFNGLANLRELTLFESFLTSLQPGAFHGLYNLRKLTLKRTRLESLPNSVFDGLSELVDLDLDNLSLARVAPGAFHGLSRLEYLVFNAGWPKECPSPTALACPNRSLETLPPNVFGELHNLEHLGLGGHRNLRTLPPGVFNGLPNLSKLVIAGTALKSLRNGLFDALPSLRFLHVFNNDELTTVEPGTFVGLRSLETLHLSSNALTTLEAGVLRGVSGLRTLDINHNPIADISALSALTNARELFLAVTSISDVAPLVANVGLGPGDFVRLDGNPWSMESRLTHIPALRQRGVDVRANHALLIGDASAVEGEPVELPVTVRPPWPRDLAVNWEVMDRAGTADPWIDHLAHQKGTLTLPAGAAQGRVVVKTLQDRHTEGDEHFVVRLNSSDLPNGIVIDGNAWFGVATILDDELPLIQNQLPQAVSVLPDIYTVVGDRTKVAAAGSFMDPDGEALAISAMSFNPAVAAVRLDEPGVVTVEALRPGLAAVVVTATDPHGETAAVTFSVRVSTSRQAVVGANDELALAQDDAVRLDLLASFRELDEHALVFVAESSDPTVATVEVGRNSVTVEAGSEGSATIVVTATDPTGENTALTFTVTVVDAPRRRGLPLWLLSKG